MGPGDSRAPNNNRWDTSRGPGEWPRGVGLLGSLSGPVVAGEVVPRAQGAMAGHGRDGAQGEPEVVVENVVVADVWARGELNVHVGYP